MSDKKRPTLQQLAAIAGVSTSAVSMILNNREDVSFAPETVQRVMDAARELGYQRRVSRKGSGFTSECIVIICPNITSPYYASLVQSIEQAARDKSCDTIIYNTYRSPDNERRLLTRLMSERPTGIVFTMKPSLPALAEEVSHTIPMVVICDRDTAVNVDTVETSNFSAGVLMGQHLLGLGHRHIAYISTTLDTVNTARTMRLEGLRSTFLAHGDDCSVLVKSSNITPQEELSVLLLEHRVGFELCSECLHEPDITAFVGINDMVAYGIADALLESGHRIPQDYSVCGFDNSFPSALQAVMLTTVEHGIEDKGHNAFEMLWSKLTAHKAGKPINRITRVEFRQVLVPRTSTGAPRQG